MAKKLAKKLTAAQNIQCVRKVAVHLGYVTVRYVDLVVSIEVAVEVCCLTVLSC
jgi:hypothetical protein